MAKYSKKAQDKVEKVMHEMKHGTLKSGGSGKKVTSRKQAIAIGLSEARESGAKVPKKASKKSASKRRSTRKTAQKSRGPIKRTATKRSAAKKRGTRKTASRRATARRSK